MAKFVVCVDDEKKNIEEYLSELAGLDPELIYFASIRECLAWLADHAEDVVGVVLDVMLPPDGVYDLAATHDGLIAGLFLYQDVRAQVGSKVPVFLLTNSVDLRIPEAISADPQAEILSKSHVLYDEFGRIVRERLAGRRSVDSPDRGGRPL